jgi:hypothetical protein
VADHKLLENIGRWKTLTGICHYRVRIKYYQAPKKIAAVLQMSMLWSQG